LILPRAETDPFMAGVGLVVRAPLLTLTVLLAAFSQTDLSVYLATGLLAAVGVAAALLPQRGARGQGVRCTETLVWSGAVVATGTTDSVLLVYLLAPALVAGLAAGFRSGIVIPGLASASIVLGNAALDGGTPLADYSASAAQWIVLAVFSVQIGSWFRAQQTTSPRDESSQAQEAAHRLLVQLRTVARRLPGTLSPAATAESLLFDLRRHVDVERGVVLVRSEGQRLVPIAFVGDQPLDWDLELSAPPSPRPGRPSSRWCVIDSTAGPMATRRPAPVSRCRSPWGSAASASSRWSARVPMPTPHLWCR
jgi:hypothetical protein